MASDRQQMARVFRGMAIYAAVVAVSALVAALWFLTDPIAPLLFSTSAVTAFLAWFSWRVADAFRRPPAEVVAEVAAARQRRPRPRVVAIHVVVLAVFLSLPVTTAIAFGWAVAASIWGVSLVVTVFFVALGAVARRRTRGV